MNHWLNTQARIIKTAAQNFIRNAWLSVAAIAVMIITLGIVLFSVIASATFNNTINTITDRINISVYLNDEVDPGQRQDLIDDLQEIENVKEVKYVSKDGALEAYKQANVNNPDLLVAISQTDNPLPASLQIKPRDPNRIEEIRTFLEQEDIKALQSDETSYSGDRKAAIDNITNATKLIQRIGIVGIIVFAFVCMLIIFNTIQMAIFNRRDELTIMRLLGASTWFIRGPFIFETIYYGIVAAVISVAGLNALFSIASQTFEASSLGLLDITYANEYFVRNFWTILTLQLAIGILIGAASSFIATRRYLKFKTSK